MEVLNRNWKEIWEDRVANIEDVTHVELLKANGYDSSRSNLTPDTLKVAQNYYSKIIDLHLKDSIYEVGCGSGAFLYPLWLHNHRVGGIDLSHNLIEVAEVNLSEGDFVQGEATEINTEEKYDHVMSFGCFLYFPSHAYAEDVILKMLDKATKTVSIYEIPDEAYKNECEEMRRENVGPSYDTDYQGLQHLYFSKQWFCDFAYKHNLHLTIFDQVIPDYESGKYRFCVVLKGNRTENK
jgi:trans-aconitate methyltransferase